MKTLFKPFVAFDETLPIETPKEQNGYAQGFVIQPPSIWHNGSMDGTSSALKFENGYSWAVVTNTRENGPNPFGVGDPIIRGSIVWPSVDLFDAPQ